MKVDLEALERDCEMTFLVAGGPGGQHRNRSATGVRLKHLPTGITVTATERRSQMANRRAAFERLRAKLEALLRKPVPRVATKPSRAARRKRLETKRLKSQTKRLRGKVEPRD